MTKIKNIGALLHKKSAVSGKTPTAAQLELGELAVNYNADEPFISFKDNADNIVKISPTSEGKPISGASGVDVNSGGSTNIISGVVDPSSENVITEYTTGGTSAETQSVLSVGANGFKVDNIQTAIDTKAAVNHKVYDPVAGVYEASSHTITYASENGELFTTPLTFDDAIDSASTNAPQNKVIKEELDKKLDKVNFLNQIYPKGSIYITETNTNPSTFIGGTWELIRVAGSKTSLWSGNSGNATINLSDSMQNYEFLEFTFKATGFTVAQIVEVDKIVNQLIVPISWDANTNRYGFLTNITNTSFTLNVGSQTTLAQVRGINVGVSKDNHYVWKRTDDAPIAMMLKPVTLERGEDVLWSGNTGSGTITLNAPIDDYDTIEFTIAAEGDWWQTFVTTPQILNTMTGNFMMAATWSSYDRFVSLSKPTGGTQFTVGSTHAALRLVKGIKDAYVSRTDITAEINSESTNDKAAGAKAVYDALAGIQFIDRSKTISWGGSTASFTVDITCGADEVPLGKGATNVQTEGAVGYAYVSTLTKLSDTSYRFTGWANGNGANTLVVNATFVKMS